ncbi:MAG: cell surface protein SprA, partial [Ignavibacteria bacterium]|nr:cell surface protein SprA [Ignavibacteria bacterium]
KGATGKVRIALLEFNLVGNQWYKPEKLDTTYNISVINIEENSQIYQSPVPGDVLRQTVRNTSGVNTKSNEQSLVLSFNNLTTGRQKLAVKDYRSQILDLFNYKVMKLFVNGDPSFNYTNELVYDAAMVIRFGSDSTNYYEYRAPIHPDIRPGQPWNSMNEVSIVFADLTALKITRDSVSQVVDIPVPNGPPGAYYRIRGSPALNSIREFTLGVEKNRTGLNTSISGSVWFNEVRVLKVNDDNGYAVNVNTSLKIADFGTASFNYSRVDPNFHALDQRTGTRTTGQNWDAGFSFNVHKILNNFLSSFLDGEWKEFLNIPVTYRHSENFINPKYYPGTDIDLEKAAEEKYRQVLAQTKDQGLAEKSKNDILTSAQTYAIRNDISVTGMSFKFPGSNYFNRVILNAFSLNFTGTYGSQRDFTYENKTDFATSGSLNYNTDFMLADMLNLNLGNIIDFGEQYRDAKVYLFVPFIPFIPVFSNGFTASIDYNRTRNESRQRLLDFDDPTGRLFKANRGFNFNWKFIENWIVDLTGTYSVKAGSDLTGFETYKDSARTQKSESEILDDIFLNEGLINFGNELDYQQSTTFNPKFNIPIINKFLDVNMNYNVTYAWTNPNSTVYSGYNVGFANTFTTGATLKFNELLNLIGVEKSAGGYRKLSLRAASNDDDKPGLGDVMKILGTFIPDLITVNFNQTNAVANPSVVGRPGFANFWITLKQVDEYGPSRMYQLGLNMDPGKRVPGYSITDVHNLANNVTFNTTISPLFPQSIRMNLTFKKNWGKNYSGTYLTQPDGSLGTPTNKNTTGTDGYSMFFAGDIDEFSFEASGDPDLNIANITTAFKDQIASFPFPNWSMTITGLEKLPLFSEFTQTVSFENSFTSEYTEGSFIDISNKEVIQRQSVVQSYNPLLGLNVTFKQLAGGSLTASFRLNKSTSNILSPSSNLVQVAKTNDWSLTANYAKSGFDIPMFGLELKNDITFSLTYSKNLNEPVDYKYSTLSSTPEKIIGNGSTITSFNPSVSYSISSKVQLMVFYKYSKTEPLEGNANIPPRTSNEGGLNVRVLIQ